MHLLSGRLLHRFPFVLVLELFALMFQLHLCGRQTGCCGQASCLPAHQVLENQLS